MFQQTDVMEFLRATWAGTVAPAVVLSVLTWLAVKLRQMIPERRRWGVRDPANLTVCIAVSAMTDTGSYKRPATGAGSTRALALIAPSLARAYSAVDFQGLRFPTEVGKRLEGDLVVLGGPKTNAITARVLSQLTKSHGLDFDDRHFAFGSYRREFGASNERGEIRSDFGLVLSIRNPFSAGKSSLTIFAGRHTFGVVSAARYFLECQRPFPSRGWVALVESDVQDGHVLLPKLIVRFKLR